MQRPGGKVEAAFAAARAKGRPEIPAVLAVRILEDAEREQKRRAFDRRRAGVSAWLRRLRELVPPMALPSAGAFAAAAALLMAPALEEPDDGLAELAMQAVELEEQEDLLTEEAVMWIAGWPDEVWVLE